MGELTNLELCQKRRHFLDDTIKYYSEDVSRRAVVDGVGKYLLPDGRRCAIGRWIKGEKMAWNLNGMGSLDDHVMSFLPDDIQELGFSFLRRVQLLHDRREYWSDRGLSLKGVEDVQCIIETFHL